MKKISTLFAMLLLISSQLPMASASAADCNSAAQAFASQNGGEVLSVVAGNYGGGTTCDVTIRIPGKNGKPPRVVTKSIKL